MFVISMECFTCFLACLDGCLRALICLCFSFIERIRGLCCNWVIVLSVMYGRGFGSFFPCKCDFFGGRGMLKLWKAPWDYVYGEKFKVILMNFLGKIFFWLLLLISKSILWAWSLLGYLCQSGPVWLSFQEFHILYHATNSSKSVSQERRVNFILKNNFVHFY